MNAGRPSPDLMSGKALFRLGLGLVVLAAVMFFRYSIEQGWIEPPVRVAMAGLAGVSMIVIGLQISTRRPAYGTLLQGGGAAVTYLTAFAAHQRYGLIEETLGFIGLAGVSALVVALAVGQRSESLGMVGVIGALAAPLLIDGRLSAFGGDAGYIATVVAVGVFLFVKMGWLRLFLTTGAAAIAAVLAESVRHLIDRFEVFTVSNPPSSWELSIDAIILLLGLWLAPTFVAAGRSGRSYETASIVGALAVPILATAVLFAAWAEVATRDGLMWMAVGLGVACAAIAWTFRGDRSIAEAHIVPAAVLPLIGWVAGLETPELLILVLVAQATAMVAAGMRIPNGLLTVAGQILTGVTLVAWIALVIEASDSSFGLDDTALGATLLVAAFGAAVQYRAEDDAVSEIGNASLWLIFAGAVGWTFASLNYLENGPGLVTAAWTMLASGLVAGGKLARSSGIRNVGFGLLLVAVGKLLLVDTAGVSGLVRMGLFAGIGAGLLILGYWLGDNPDSAIAEIGTEDDRVESLADTD